MSDVTDHPAQPDKPSTSSRYRQRKIEDGTRHIQRLPKLKEGEYTLTCQWSECQETCMRLSDMFLHVTEHIQLYLLQMVGPQSSLQSSGICCTCGWRECGAQILGSILDFNRHVYFHVYHMQLKCQGAHRMKQLSLGPCNMGGQSQNWIPELPDNLQCFWDNCKIIFDNAYHFYGHVGQHSEEHLNKSASMRCLWTDCKAILKGSSKLKEHLRSHTQEKIVACPTCGGLFSSHTKLIDHIQRQAKADMLRYECSYCNRRFSTERMLKDHMRRHINSYKCTMCEMTCPAPSALRIHMMYKHSEEKPFKCGHCEFSAKSSTDLRKHLDSHNVEDQFSCHVNNCPFSARCYISLAMHFKKHHESLDLKTPRYKCHVCNREFSRGYSLTFHLKKNHRFQWPPGHSRFRYKLHEDGFLRLQTYRYECTDIDDLPAGTPEKVNSHKNPASGRTRRRKQIVTSMITPLPPLSPPGDGVGDDEARQGQTSGKGQSPKSGEGQGQTSGKGQSPKSGEGQGQTSGKGQSPKSGEGQGQTSGKRQLFVETLLSRAEGRLSEVRERRVEGRQTDLDPGLTSTVTSAVSGSQREASAARGAGVIEPPPSPPGPLIISLPQTKTAQAGGGKEKKTARKRNKKQIAAQNGDDVSNRPSVTSTKHCSKTQFMTETENASNNLSTAPTKKRSRKKDMSASNSEAGSKVGEPSPKRAKKTAVEETPSVNEASNITKSNNNSTSEHVQSSATKISKKNRRKQNVKESQNISVAKPTEIIHKTGKKLLKEKTDVKESTAIWKQPNPTPDTNMDVEDPEETEDLAELEEPVQKRIRKPTLKVAALLAKPSDSKLAAIYNKPSSLKTGTLASKPSEVKDAELPSKSSDLKVDALTSDPSASKPASKSTKPSSLKVGTLSSKSSDLTVGALIAEPSTSKHAVVTSKPSTLKIGVLASKTSDLKIGVLTTEPLASKPAAKCTQLSALKVTAPDSHSSDLTLDAPSTKPSALKVAAPTTISSDLTLDSTTEPSDIGKGKKKTSVDRVSRRERKGKISLLQSRKFKKGITHVSTRLKSKQGSTLRSSDVKSQQAKVVTDTSEQDNDNETDRKVNQSTTKAGGVSGGKGGRKPEGLRGEYGDTGEANLHMLGDVALTSLLKTETH